MNRDDIIRMAREAKLLPQWLELCPKDEKALERFFHAAYAAGAAAEREECAKVCEQMPDLEHGWRANLPSDCAAAIRSRGNK